MALDHLHDKKILHRDLKTKNIFITKKNQVKLGDFGLSKMLGTTSFAQSAVGTPYYLSPELCEGKRYNHKSDVWAIGCVLYELTTFKHAFDATNLPALVMAIVQGSYAPVPDTYSAHLKVRCSVHACTAKQPVRWQVAERENVFEITDTNPPLRGGGAGSTASTKRWSCCRWNERRSHALFCFACIVTRSGAGRRLGCSVFQ